MLSLRLFFSYVNWAVLAQDILQRSQFGASLLSGESETKRTASCCSDNNLNATRDKTVFCLWVGIPFPWALPSPQ